MRRTTVLASFALVAASLLLGCNSNSNPAHKVLGHPAETPNGLSLVADPSKIVIDPANPATPTDPAHNNERYGESTLTATATDSTGAVQPNLDITFGTAAGVLASGGAPVKTDANGVAKDTLRVYESDPDSIQVSAGDGSRVTTAVVTKVVAQPPVANAGPDQTVECTGDQSAMVRLDGSASIDPNNDVTTYEWFENYGAPTQRLLGTGAVLNVRLALGVHVVTLKVTDATGKTSTDEVKIEVVDTTPPRVSLSISPTSLWPPNHRMVSVHATVRVDDCGPVQIFLDSVTSSEPDNGLGDGDTVNDIQGADLGTADFDFALRAERSGGGSGRVYTIVYRVVDEVGLETHASALVKVPHDQSGR